MKPILAFAASFGAQIAVNPDWVIEKAGRFYLLNPSLSKLAKSDYYYAGLYLGKAKGAKFFPSFNLLNLLVVSAANKVVLDGKAAWLFICDRDVFRKGIVRVYGARRNCNTLVLNEFGECLGFGRIYGQLNNGEGGSEVAVKNVLDVGDFLRRERF
jgi:ribosome biogenesis protein Nip4